jgi:KAP family P-loop domain
MKARLKHVLLHILDSVLVVIFASVIATCVLAYWPLDLQWAPGWASADSPIPHILLPVLLILPIFVLAAALAPRQFLSAVSGIWHCPCHWGLVVRCLLGGCLSIALLRWFSHPWVAESNALKVALIGYMVIPTVSLFVGWLFAWALSRDPGKRPRRRGKATPHGPQKSAQGRAVADPLDLREWLSEDRPIENADDNRLPAHLDTARRVLQRLTARSDSGEAGPGNVAVIGRYGSGKTSICNLVESEYKYSIQQNPNWPRLLFCRFEAWRYLNARAALRGLVEVAAMTALKEADEPSLWSLGESYLHAVAEAGTGWASSIAVLLRGTKSPDDLLDKLDDLLVRLDRHLVVFVDDLDRLESVSDDQQQALIQALNQFNSTKNTNYVLSAGPAQWATAGGQQRRPLLDLLKLTQFQELVPEIDIQVALDLVRQLRDQAKNEPSLFLPWAETADSKEDPLKLSPVLRYIESAIPGLCAILGELLRTPRALKTALRETHIAWEHDLKGEINWYDLLLANALKVAEPAVFEWVLRDRDLFMISSNEIRVGSAEERKQEEKRIQKRLRDILQAENGTDLRHDAVTEALQRLFPVFAEIAGSGSRLQRVQAEAEPSGQRLASTPVKSQSYFQRFVSGCVPDSDLPDRPTLKYVKKVRAEGLDPQVFEDAYLGSMDKITGPLNKVVQFSAFLGGQNVLHMCDVILNWTARPESMGIWSQRSRFYSAMCADVYHTLRGSQNLNLDEWLPKSVLRIAVRSPLLSVTLIEMLSPSNAPISLISHEKEGQLVGLWAKTVVDHFITGLQPLASVVTQYRFQLAHLLIGLKKHYGGYEEIKKTFTAKLIDEVGPDRNPALQREILLALTDEVRHAMVDDPVPVDAYQFTYSKDKNNEWFDMSAILPILKKWHAEGVADLLAQRVIRELATEYDFGNA